MATIEVLKVDITELQIDVIVNAANGTLLGGGGVDGAIHRAAGPGVFQECWRIGSCATGDAAITSAGLLAAKHIIHAVGPRYDSGKRGEAVLLEAAYERCLTLAGQHNARSIAFPPLSCGNFRFPIAQAADIAIATVKENVSRFPSIERVVFACLEDDTYYPFLKAAS